MFLGHFFIIKITIITIMIIIAIIIITIGTFFSCPEQLIRWPCPLVRPSGTTNNQSLHNTTEWTQRLVTFETFDQTDFQKNSDFWKIFRCLENVQIFEKNSNFWKISDFDCEFGDIWSERWGNMTWSIWQFFLTILTIFDNFHNYW